MGKRIAIIQGHPDPRATHLGHALAFAYADGAVEAGHTVRNVNVATLDFPVLHTREDWEKQEAPPAIRNAQATIEWADHLFIIHPLWLGSMPAMLKAFFEQVFRPEFATRRDGGAFKRMLAGRSAHVVVTMGMPGLLYRWFFLAHGLRSLVRNVLKFSGISPVRTTVIGMVEADRGRRVEKWLPRMRELGAAAR